jgi:acyl-CoA hydrolase
MVYSDEKLHVRPVGKANEIDKKIGQIIAENLVEDRATLQMGAKSTSALTLHHCTGIGAIPDAALAALTGHKDLGIHTEMFSDGVLDLVHCGAVTNAYKLVHPGKIVSGFVYGSEELYGFLHDNPMIREHLYLSRTRAHVQSWVTSAG